MRRNLRSIVVVVS